MIQGSDLRAGHSATLQTDNAIQLLAAQNTSSQPFQHRQPRATSDLENRGTTKPVALTLG